MKEFKGTKGEWKLVHESQVAFSQEDFSTKDCDLYEHQYDSFDEMRANAKLIAAAPYLLEESMKLIQQIKMNNYLEINGHNIKNNKSLLDLEKAINKALN